MKKIGLMLVLSATLLLGAACGQGDTDNGNGGTTGSETATSSTQATEVTIKTADGEKTVVKDPKKVVVFDNSALDTMNELGVGDRVVGAATDSLPDFLSSYQKVESAGGIKEPDMEKINAMQPDLIIISGRQKDFQEELDKIAPTLYFSTDATDTWGSIQEQVKAIATIFGKETGADKAIAKLQKRIDSVKEKATASQEKALVLLVNEGSLSAYGEGSRFGIVHDTFGFPQADEAIEASTHGQNVSYEYVLEKNPDVIFVVDRTKAIGGDDSKNNLAENELVKQTNAGKNGKIVVLDPSVWYLAGSGLESVDIMLTDVSKALTD